MRGQVLKRVLGSTGFLGVMLFVFSVIFPPFEDLTAVNLSLHMLQHVLIVISGVLVAFPLYRRFGSSAAPRRWAGRVGLLAVSLLFVFWHLPGPWDSAVLDPLAHAAEHFSFFFGGILIGSVVRELSDSAKIGALLLAFFGHMAYAVVLISPWNIRVYPLYSLDQQVTLGWILLVTGGSFLVGVAFIVTKNPRWLQGASGQAPMETSVTSAPRKKLKHGGVIAPALSVLLFVILLGYFAVTVLAIGSAPAEVPPNASVVYISETPVSWQYSPQHIEVVLGTNNTVIWVSHSVSYDTITGSGNFASGPIAPGDSYSYTFTTPGVYDYHCIYHPWMVGTVTVLAASG